LWVLPRPTGTPFRLLPGDTPATDGQFSPDGRWVAYTTKENGKDEVYVVPFHPRSVTRTPQLSITQDRWRISASGGRWPRWRGDGRELIYLSSDNTLMAVPVLKNVSGFSIGGEQKLFRVNPGYYNLAYDISPDAKRFIVNTGAKEKAAPITLVQNWLADFRK
jgi:Tol biopolymer transport system component